MGLCRASSSSASMVAGGDLKNLVVDVGRGLKRSRDESLPLADILEQNWFDSPASLTDAKPEELVALGIPMRFAKDLIKLAQEKGTSSSSRSETRRESTKS